MNIKRLLHKGCASRREAEANLKQAVAARIDDLTNGFPWLSFELAGRYVPRVDVAQTDDRMLVTAEIPGAAAPSVAISRDGLVLTIEGEKREPNGEDDGARKCRSERAYGAFRRTVRLPASSSGTAFDATHEDGVLSVSLLKVDQPARDIADQASEPDAVPAPIFRYS